MRVPNDLQFDTETYLLFSIYYNAYRFEGIDTAASYLKEFKTQIHATGQVLEWLGLATPDKSSPLGSKPSHALIDLVAKPRRRSKSRKTCSTPDDDKVFDMIFDATVHKLEDWFDIPHFVLCVFHYLGLAKEADFDFVPAPGLRSLACERRQEERRLRGEERRVNSA
jgi:hypothetical protein